MRSRCRQRCQDRVDQLGPRCIDEKMATVEHALSETPRGLVCPCRQVFRLFGQRIVSADERGQWASEWCTQRVAGTNVRRAQMKVSAKHGQREIEESGIA